MSGAAIYSDPSESRCATIPPASKVKQGVRQSASSGVRFLSRALGITCTTRQRFSHLGLLLMGLALSVFAWGLQYKLSLYQPPQSVSHRVPMAKLLSREEQGGSTESPLITSRPSSQAIQGILSGLFLTFFTIFSLVVVQFGQFGRMWFREPSPPRCLARFFVLFFRPPPALVACL